MAVNMPQQNSAEGVGENGHWRHLPASATMESAYSAVRIWQDQICAHQ
jgi:hypothetical protein